MVHTRAPPFNLGKTFSATKAIKAIKAIKAAFSTWKLELLDP